MTHSTNQVLEVDKTLKRKVALITENKLEVYKMVKKTMCQSLIQ